MKTKITAIVLSLCLSALSLLQAQIRSDFIMFPGGNDPHISIDAQGNLNVTTWNDDGIVYAIFDSMGNKLKEPILISDSSVIQQTPRLAVKDTHVIVVWRAIFSFGGDYILGQQLTSSGDTVSNNIRYSEYCCPTLFSPDVTFLTDSTYRVVWTGEGSLTPGFDGVYGQLATTSGKFIGNNQQFSDHAMRGVDHGQVRILRISPGEDFVVIWMDDSLGSREVFARLFLADGTPRGSSFLVSEDPGLARFWRFNAAIGPHGAFAVAWSAEKDTVNQIQWRRFNSDGLPLGPSEQVDSGLDVDDSFTVDIASDLDGNYVVVWDQRDKIYGQRFLPNGTTFGDNFQISLSLESFRDVFPSTALSNGKLYTAWLAIVDSLYSTYNTMANILTYNDPTVRVNRHSELAPNTFNLFQNYPNPFNPTTRIRFDIAKQSQIQVVIYNTLGEKIQTLLNEEMLPGSHAVMWNGKNAKGGDVTSGLYFIELRAAGSQLIGKMLLVR